MRIRSALIITVMFVVVLIVLPKSNSALVSERLPISAPMRTVLLPPIPAPAVVPIPLAPPPPAAPASVPVVTAPPIASDYAAWTRVAVCEEGGWIGYAGPAYPDSLGINAANWSAYGGGTDLSPSAQIAVADRIEAAAGTPGYVPDQGYCAAW